MSVTIYDIAKRARVGVGTVSRVLNNHPSVSPSTRARVLAVAQRMEYRPNSESQRLARKRSRTATVIMPFVGNYFCVELLRHIQEEMYARDYDLLIYGVNHPRQIEGFIYRSLRISHTDGILLASLDVPETYTQECLRSNFPLVLIDAHVPQFDSFSVENTGGARIATAYLHVLGHRRTAMITGAPDSKPSRERIEGYLAAVSACVDAEDIGVFTPTENDLNEGFTREGGAEVMRTVLALPSDRRPTALFVASDAQAIGAIDVLRERGLSCPDDCSIVSFDDVELARYYGLTTMRQHIREMSAGATERLFALLDNPGDGIVHRQFTPELIVRRTTAPPRNGHA